MAENPALWISPAPTEPLILIAALLTGVAAGMTIERLRVEKARRAWRERKGRHQERSRPQAATTSPPLAPTAETLAPSRAPRISCAS